MLFREVEIFNGDRYRVPQCIQRIDHRATHGWQLRYGGTRLFSDHSSDGSGAEAALAKATRELVRRIATMDAPTTLQRAPSANKSSGLPPGISGPIVRGRVGGRLRGRRERKEQREREDEAGHAGRAPAIPVR